VHVQAAASFVVCLKSHLSNEVLIT